MFAFIDGEISLREMERIEKHLSQCFACRDVLSLVKEEIKLVETNLESLDPKIIPQISKVEFEMSKSLQVKKPFIFRLLFSKVKVPVPALVFFASVILALTAMLFSEYTRSDESVYTRKKKSHSDSLYVSFQNNEYIIPINFDLNEFRPIEKPDIFVISMEER